MSFDRHIFFGGGGFLAVAVNFFSVIFMQNMKTFILLKNDRLTMLNNNVPENYASAKVVVLHLQMKIRKKTIHTKL